MVERMSIRMRFMKMYVKGFVVLRGASGRGLLRKSIVENFDWYLLNKVEEIWTIAFRDIAEGRVRMVL